jgi:predicted nucleic acid-binding protein
VFDASLALKWVVEEPYSVEARSLLTEWGTHRRKLLAPALFLYEVANALAKRIQRREFTLEQVKERLRFFLESGLLLQQIGAIHPRALELMERFGLLTAYDAHYLALAESHRCEC